MTFTCRDGVPRDAEALDQLYDTVFCETFAHLYRPEDLAEFLGSYGVEDWRAELADPKCAFRIAEVDGKVAGYAKLSPMKHEFDIEAPALFLDQLYVLKEHHGGGIAHALMDWTLEEGRRRSAEFLYLGVFTENHRARRFYDRYGFEAVGRYDFMVGSHADEDILMRRSL